MRTWAEVDTFARLTAGTHAVVDLDAYIRNLQTLRSIAPAGAALMAVVKADAYGHGMVECARSAVDAADWLGVARIQEAMRLRQSGIVSPILVLGPPNIPEVVTAVENDITLTIGSDEHFGALLDIAGQLTRPARVHLKVDTGMRRYGFLPEQAPVIAERMNSLRMIDLDGIYTHFSSSDELDPGPTDRQIERFEATLHAVSSRGIRPRFVHLANSSAILTGKVGPSNLVRSGIATYGLSPSGEVPVDERFKPILSLRTTITRRFTLEEGEGVSYGLSYRATAPEEVAATAIGYADGLPRQLSNTGWYVVAGTPYRLRGRVCMDQSVIASSQGVNVGDTVQVYGPGDCGEMTLDEIARIAGTNNYEIATRVMARVPRIYMRDNRPIAWEHLLLGESGSF